MDDTEEFNILNNALGALNLDQAFRDELWALTAALLYLGNVDYGDGDQVADFARFDILKLT